MRLIDYVCEPIASSSSSYFIRVMENIPCSSTIHESKSFVRKSYKSIQQLSIFHSIHAGQTSNTSNMRCGVDDKFGSKSGDCFKSKRYLSEKRYAEKTIMSAETMSNELLNNYNSNHGWFSSLSLLLLLLLLFWCSPTTLAASNEMVSANSTLTKNITTIERFQYPIIPSATNKNHGSTNLSALQPHPSMTSTIHTAAASDVNNNSVNLPANSSPKVVNDISPGSKSSDDKIEIKREIANAIPSSAPTNSENDDSNFNDDCSDQHYKEFRCSVTSASCQLGTDEWLRANLESDAALAEKHLSPSTTEHDRVPTAAGLWRLYDTPGEAHDIRIEPFAKARGSRRRLRDGKRQSAVATATAERRGRNHHQLTVDISWQTPPNNSTRQLSAFLLEIVEVREEGAGVGGGDSSIVGDGQLCFLLDVSESNWTEDAILSSPRLHFSSSGIFKFSRAYSITLRSLPRVSIRRLPRRPLAEVTQRFVTPQNPYNGGLNRQPPTGVGNDGNSTLATKAVGDGRLEGEATPSDDGINGTALSANCTKFSHPYASKWTAGFRRIYLHTLARTIQVEFVGAPPQYCFEQYEVRLLDETATEMLHFGIVPVSAMRTEWIDNTVIYFGEYNFTGLDMDRSYIPSVIPVEKALDGRCLCPVYGIDPYDNKVVCSCIAADWKPVRLTRLDVVKEDLGNATTAPNFLVEQKSTFSDYWLLFSLLNFILFLVVVCIALIAFVIYYQHRSGKIAHIRFIKNAAASANGTSAGGAATIANGCGASAVEAQPYDASSISRAPLIVDAMDVDGRRQNAATAASAMNAPQLAPLNVLLVYAHDSPEHDAAVLALAELLRDAFKMNVGLDMWDATSIECNLADYLSASVINADKVVVVNSIGAYHRFHCKVTECRFVIERNTHVSFDGLFVPQMDMVMQHHCIISVRFVGTPNTEVLPLLTGRLQYVLPDNLVPFLSALVGHNVKGHSRLNGQSTMRLGEAARHLAATRTAGANNDWFVRTHHRRAVSSPSCLDKLASVIVGRLPATTVVQSTPADSGVVVTIDDVEENDINLADMRETLPLVVASLPEDSGLSVNPTTDGHIGSAIPELVFSAATPNTSVPSSPAVVRRANDIGDDEKREQGIISDSYESSQNSSNREPGGCLSGQKRIGTSIMYPESVTSTENAEFDVNFGRHDDTAAASSSNGSIASSSVAEDDDDAASGEDSSLDSNNNNVAADSGVFTESFDQHSAVRSPYASVDRHRPSIDIGRLEEEESVAVEPVDTRQQCNGYTELKAVVPVQHIRLPPANPRSIKRTDDHHCHTHENANVEMIDFRPSATDRPNNRRNRRNANISKNGMQSALESSRPLRSDDEDANDSAMMISNGGDDVTIMVNGDEEATKYRPPTTSRRKGKRHQQQRQYYPIPS